jgi:carbon-monoxide dehydrogenase large subunit
MLRGRSVIFYIEHAGIFNDRMELRFDPGGTVTIVSGMHSHGQGHATTFAQMVSDWLGVPFNSIRFLQGDTDKVTFGRGTYAARSSLVGGVALRMASDIIIDKARVRAAEILKVPEDQTSFEDGQFSSRTSNQTLSIADVAKSLFQPVHLDPKYGLGLEAVGTASGDVPNYPNGCHVCEVEIDPATGRMTIERYTVVDDVGVAINPMICEGQIHGGVVQGIGQAMLEEIVYDADGQMLSGSLMDYCLPRADDICDLNTKLAEFPSPTNPLGLKGVGESGTIGAPPAIVNAVIDALRPVGVDHIDMPVTPRRIWHAIQSAQAARNAKSNS